MKNNHFSRRTFLKKSALTTGFFAAGSVGMAGDSLNNSNTSGKLPREVWIGTFSQSGLTAGTSKQMVDRVIEMLKEMMSYRPDIICLPEVFPTSNIEKQYSLREKLALSGEALKRFSQFARQNACYLICPVYTSDGKNAYNSAVVIDRKGKQMGAYHKIHLTTGEIEAGLTPGPLEPPVFSTDFGKSGIQIWFDIKWEDGCTKISEQGAEMVFWPSAFGGGEQVNTKAWQHKYSVISSTRKSPSKICDISGNTIAKTGLWNKNFICASVNLEKVFLHTWPYVRHFDEIRKKYGRKVKITTFHEEEWSIIESLSSEVSVDDLLKEFNLKTHEQHILEAEAAQVKARRKSNI